MDLGLNIPSTDSLTTHEKALEMIVELNIGLISAPLPHIISLGLLYSWVYLFVETREVEIGIISSTSLHITMVDYAWSTQGSLRILFQGVFEDKIYKTVIKAVFNIHIKIILIILIQAFHNSFIQACHHISIQNFYLTLIQVSHHTLFVYVHIALLLIYMHLMQFHTIHIYYH